VATLWVTIAVAATQLATLVSNIAVANLLGPAMFGVYGFVQTTQNAFALVAQLSLGLAATRYLPEWRSSHKTRAGDFLGNAPLLIATFGLLLAGLLVGFASTMQDASFMRSLPQPLLATLLITIPGLALVFLQNGVFVGFEWFRRYASFSVLAALASVALPAVGAAFAELEGAIVGLALAVLVRVLGGGVAIIRKLPATGLRPSLGGDGTFSRVVRDFAIPSSLGGALAVGAQWVSALMLLHTAGNEPFGLYVASLAVRQIVVFIPAQLSGVALTLMSKNSAPELKHRVFRLNVIVTSVLAALVTALAIVFGQNLLAAFGPGFATGTVLLQVILASAFLESVTMAIYQLLPSRGRMWRSLTWVVMPRDGSLLLLAWILIPDLDAIGLAIALLASQAVSLVGTLLALRLRA
jgi:O-antigen/teichoic acid export membrane protein